MTSKTSNRKVALITGVSSGMRKDFAEALLAEGMVVYTAARRVERMTDLKDHRAIPLKMDITITSRGGKIQTPWVAGITRPSRRWKAGQIACV